MEEAFTGHRIAYLNMPDWQVEVQASAYTTVARGELAAVSDDLSKLLECKPYRLVRVVKDIYDAV